MEREFFQVTVENHFTASHQLRFADGTREELHSHNWVVRTAVTADRLDRMGLAIDFSKLTAMVEFIISPFETVQLEQNQAFMEINSSAENVAKYIYLRLREMLAAEVRLDFVEVMEADGCWARYYKEIL